MTGEGPVGGRRGPYSPKGLLSAVQRAHPSFRGFHQQDAHELFMRLVGTLEDEEDSCIKERRQEEKEAQDATREEEGVNGSVGGMGSEGEGSPADTKAGSTSTAASQSPEEDRKPFADDGERAGGALAGNDGALATPGAEKEGSDAVASDNATGQPATPDGLSLPKASSVLAPASGHEQETSVSSDGAVAAAPDASTDPLCDRGEAELSTTSGETCAKNGAANGHTANGKRSGDAEAGSAEAAGAIAGGEDEEVVVVEPDHTPIGCSSANEKEAMENDSQRCSGVGRVNADADTSTDDGETTDAGDHDDDDDDEVDGAAVSSASRPPPGSSAGPVGTGVSSAVEAPKEEEKDDREDAVAAVPPAVPQRAAVTEVFGGTMCSVVTCSSCGGRSFCTEPTICLSLEIPLKPKALSTTALAFIAKKKAAAAAKAAAASAETADAESGTTTADSTSTAEGRPSPASSDDLADESVTEPYLGEEKADEVEGFQLSAKEKRKVARQERDKQRAIKAKAKADEEASGDAAGSPGPESDGSGPATAKSTTEGTGAAAQTPPDGDEVRRCLEYIVSACVADAGADGDGGDVAGLGSEAVAVEEETDAGGIEADETEGNAPEALLPGFELSAKERKKIARQEKFERQRSMGQEASTEGGGKEAPQTSQDEGHEPSGEGGERTGASEQSTPCTTVRLEPEDGTARSTSKSAAQQSAEKPSAGGEGEEQSAAVDDSGKCSGGDGGAGSVGEKDGSASNASTAVSTDPASPVAETPPASSSTGPEDGQAQQPTARAADTCEQPDCDGQKCGDDPPAPEAVIAGAEANGQSGQAEVKGAVAQVAHGGPRDRIEIGNDPDGAGALSSSGSLAGCTTGETQGSTDLRGDLGSAFGSECSEGNKNEEKPDGSATPIDPALACVSSSDEPGTEVNKGPGEHAPVADSPPTDLEESKEATEGEVVSSERAQGSPLPNGSVSAADVSAADEDGHVVQTADGSTAELGGEPAAAKEGQEEATASAPSTASQSPLDRLEEPPARAKPDRRHDVDGVDLYGCLDHFMAEEKLVAEDGNGYDCEGCSSRARPSTDENDGGGVEDKPAAPRRQQNAKKRLLMLGQSPGVLVCHLKRLQAKRKIIRSVEFPIELDMAPYFWRDPKAPLTPKQTCYRLSGLIQHRGSRLGGHYVAYVRDKDGWKHASDSAIRTATLPELKACEAYMLFYEQMGSADAEGNESGVSGSGIASGCSDGDAGVDETSGDTDAAESGGAVLSAGSTPAADAEAVKGEQGEKEDDEGGVGASPEGQGEEDGEGVTSGETEAREEEGESDAVAEQAEGGGPPNEEIWI